MARLAEGVRRDLVDMVMYLSGKVRFAEEIDALFSRELMEKLLDHAYFDLESSGEQMTITLYQHGRDLFHETRRTLGLHRMDRTFDESSGQFLYSGPTNVLGRPVKVIIRTADHAGCEIERVTESVQVTRYVARCKETVEVPVEGEDVLPAETPKEVVESGQSSDPASDVL